MDAVIVLAAGVGKRMKADVSKQYLIVGGQHLLTYTLRNVKLVLPKAKLVLVYKKGDEAHLEKVFDEAGMKKEDLLLVYGGKERQDSVYNGLLALPSEVSHVYIHDGARPFVSQKMIENLKNGLKKYDAVVPVLPVNDTVKAVDLSGEVKKTLDRSVLKLAQTPQVFQKDLILALHAKAKSDGFLGTDDVSLAEYYGVLVMSVEGDLYNKKITVPEDIAFAEWRIYVENRDRL